MKKILIATHNLGMGGVETSIINMLNGVDYTKYEVDLLLKDDYILNKNLIPKQVNISIIKWRRLKNIFIDNIKKLKLIEILKILVIYCTNNNKKKNDIIFKYIENNPKKYDIAIAYHSEFEAHYLESKVTATNKVVFVHVNPKTYIKTIKDYLKLYEKFDLVICVSNKLKQIVIDLNINLKNKIKVIQNMIDTKKILELSKIGETYTDNFEGTKILTIGRVSKVKGYELAIDALKKLKADGYNVKWYVIGDYNEHSKNKKDTQYVNYLKNILVNQNLEKDFIFLGGKENPYSYLKNCDIYVQPSIDETYCISTAEAKIFNLPIVRTDTPGAEEQFENMKNGIITDISVDSIYNGIKQYLDNKKLKEKIINKLKEENKNNYLYDQIEIIDNLLSSK